MPSIWEAAYLVMPAPWLLSRSPLSIYIPQFRRVFRCSLDASIMWRTMATPVVSH